MNFNSFFRLFHWRFLQLSAFLVFLILVSPFIYDRWLIKAITNFILLNSIIVVLSANNNFRLLRYGLFSLWTGTIVFSILSLSAVNEINIKTYNLLETLFSLTLLALMIVCILMFIFNSNNANFDSIFASFTVYLMLGLFFGFVYYLLESAMPGSFYFSQNNEINNHEIKSSLIYFSMVTIATLGYGDIVPVAPFSRAVSVVEAFTGQFFVTVVVAILVGKFISSERKAS